MTNLKVYTVQYICLNSGSHYEMLLEIKYRTTMSAKDSIAKGDKFTITISGRGIPASKAQTLGCGREERESTPTLNGTYSGLSLVYIVSLSRSAPRAQALLFA